jgi:hypothetical protein
VDPVIEQLLRYGWQGVVIAIVVLLAKAFAPAIGRALPAWASARSKREDLLLEALRQATRVMAEMVAALQSLRVEVGQIRADQGQLRSDVELIADRLDMPRLKRPAPVPSGE